MLHAVIMAGGAGTRFWPASTRQNPKQLLDLASDRSMIQETVARLGDLCEPQQVMIVTNERLVDAIGKQLPELPPEQIVGEPCKRDTAPCIGLAAELALAQDENATLAVMPADHVIGPIEVYQQAMKNAVQLVEADSTRLVTFGIKPEFPAETYGYIERGEPVTFSDAEVYRVNRFREKPTRKVAEEYIEQGNFYWNAGIFVWKARTILSALKEYEPIMHAHIGAIGEAIGSSDYNEVLNREFSAIKGKSIDFAVMEKHPNVVVLEAPFDWDDVGTWTSLSRLRGEDENNNTLVGKIIAQQTKGCIIRSSGEHLITTLGVSNLIIVHTPRATLVADRNNEESIRDLVRQIQENGWEEYL